MLRFRKSTIHLLAGFMSLGGILCAAGQEPKSSKVVRGATLPTVPAAQKCDRPLPINLASALKLAGAKPLDIAIAQQRVVAAESALQRARVLWLPSVYLGADYFRHDGRIQDVAGNIIDTSKSAIMVGAGPNVVFAVSDAIYGPLSARQLVRARQEEVQASRNDSLLSVADAYINVQQARGEVAGAVDALERTQALVERVEKLAEGLSPAVEKNRALTELARRHLAVEAAYEHWQVASADLTRLLRLDPTALVEPVEDPQVCIELIDASRKIDDLIPLAFTNRPELAAHQAVIQAALARIRQEKVRPLIPTVMIRGAATNPAGTLAAGSFGGGIDDQLSKFGSRNSIDFQLLWEFQNLGFGNRALVRQREAESQLAMLDLMRTQESIAAEVVQAEARLRRAANRLGVVSDEVRNAVESAEKNLEGLKQTRQVEGVLVLVFRPQEVVASIQSLDQAYRDYYTAVADVNRAQFRLYRALGQPAQILIDDRCAQALIP